MNAVFAAIEKLYPELTKNKKLALGWAIFILAIGWVVYFAQIYSAEKAQIEHFLVEMDALDADFENTLIISDVVAPQLVEAIQVRIYFLENFSGKYPYDTVKPEIVVDGYKKVTDVLSGIASARGVMSSVNFSMQELNVYREGFSQDLTLMETYLKDYEKFYVALIQGNPKEALSISADFTSSNAVESLNGFQSRLKSFSNDSDIALKKRKVDIDQKINEVSLFNFKKFITWASVIYILIFIPSVIIYHRRLQLKLKRKQERRNKNKAKKKTSPQKTGYR